MNIISVPDAPLAVGPYSQAVRTGNLLYCSGQIPVHPTTGKIESSDVEGQVNQVIANVKAVLAGAGLTIKNVLKSTLFLQDIGDFTKVERALHAGFEGHVAARSTIQAERLPLGSLVELEVIAGYP
jgi:2-iminobutanoate/2-iminopropanoate deaminase